jgi:hypothetical protein
MLVDRVAEWALGERQRMVRKKSRTAAQLLVLPQQGTPSALLGHCVNARSLLPSSENPREVYLIVDGKLYIIETNATQPRLLPIAIEPANVVLTHWHWHVMPSEDDRRATLRSREENHVHGKPDEATIS